MELGYILFFLFASVIVISWLTIDKKDFEERFEHNRKANLEDQEI